jgi:hypothetical protein
MYEAPVHAQFRNRCQYRLRALRAGKPGTGPISAPGHRAACFLLDKATTPEPETVDG